MSGASLNSLVAAGLTAFISLIFARAAWHKLEEFTEFTGFVADYKLLPERLVIPASWAIVGVELAVVVVQLLPQGRVFGLGLAFFMLVAYASAMAVNLSRGRFTIECGCGGAAQPLSWSLVGRNTALSALGLAAILLPLGPMSAPDAMAAIASGFALWMGFLLIEQILANASTARLTR
ncbi:MauE/DoxX family redox-associated membrane protein [Devosia sp.]|uniref:MauE/DoxX family redox-associated membrane protein n=1 Tax=Devosia sp. TaxID=1871048 RepID=UPI001B228369|nr:MauE/DoxX family redox-associated membrane protein [Devosia sp.]MBO9590805.1 hypothetical protein [Devosia sp.]